MSSDWRGLIAARASAPESSIRTEEKVSPSTRGGLAAFQTLILSLAISVWIGFAILAGFALFGHWSMLASVIAGIGSIGPLVAIPLLMENLYREIRSGGYWRRSPFEEILGPALVDYLEQDREQAPTVPRIVPWEVNGHTHATSAAPAHPVQIAREDARMLDFLQIAITRRIDAPTRRKMRADDGQPHFTLSQCREPLTREVYEQVLADLERWQFVAKRPGIGWTWRVNPAEAYRVLSEEVERRR